MMNTKRKPLKAINALLFLLFSCFLLSACSQEIAEDQAEATAPPEDLNKAAITAVIQSEFTGPNEEYTRLLNDLFAKLSEFSEKAEAGEVYTTDPMEGTPESEAYNAFLEKTYAPYFMDYAFDTFKIFAFSYQSSLTDEQDLDYQMSVDDIEVVQSENAPKNYTFTAQVEFENASGETAQYEISGKAICSEEGKIGRIEFGDKDGLLTQQVRGDAF